MHPKCCGWWEAREEPVHHVQSCRHAWQHLAQLPAASAQCPSDVRSTSLCSWFCFFPPLSFIDLVVVVSLAEYLGTFVLPRSRCSLCSLLIKAGNPLDCVCSVCTEPHSTMWCVLIAAA